MRTTAFALASGHSPARLHGIPRVLRGAPMEHRGASVKHPEGASPPCTLEITIRPLSQGVQSGLHKLSLSQPVRRFRSIPATMALSGRSTLSHGHDCPAWSMCLRTLQEVCLMRFEERPLRRTPVQGAPAQRVAAERVPIHGLGRGGRARTLRADPRGIAHRFCGSLTARRMALYRGFGNSSLLHANTDRAGPEVRCASAAAKAYEHPCPAVCQRAVAEGSHSSATATVLAGCQLMRRPRSCPASPSGAIVGTLQGGFLQCDTHR